MDQITEVKTTLAGRTDRFFCDVAERSGRHVVVVYRVPKDREVHGVWLPEGTVTVGYFWQDRPYNLYHWIGPDGRTLAYYFNIGDVTRYDGDTVEWRDLAVDILATPDGPVQVLDEDELPADLDPATRRYVEAALDEVVQNLGTLTAAADRKSSAVLSRLARR